MGIVYKVEQVFWEKELALKTIDKNYLSDKTTRRFQHEARATFAVDHPNIVSVHDYGLLDDQTPFLAMELVRGKTLAEVLAACARLPYDQAIPIFVQVCFGLAHAHTTGVVHRDIKPSNIMLIEGAEPGTEGSVKILDFGIAKFTQHDAGEIQALTQTGEIFGSPLYMSPEQCTGTRVDKRSDVYSLGCVLYETLTGTPPFAGENVLATLMMHQSEPLLSLKEASLGEEFPPELETIVQTMLAKKPEDRYQNLGIAANDLAALARGSIKDISVLKTTQSSAKASRPEATVTMSKAVLVIQMIAISIVSAIASAFITQSIKGDQPAFIAGNEPPKLPELLAKLPPNILNEVGQQQNYVLKHTELKRVDLSQIHDHMTVEETLREALKAIAIPKTTDIRLRDSTISSEVLHVVSKVYRVEVLDFSQSEISNKDLGLLARMPRLKRVNMIATNFNDTGAEQLSKCHSIDTIKATSTKLTDAGLLQLAKIKTLQQLKIENCDVTTKGVMALCRNRNFAKVFLAECKWIGPDEQKMLVNKFPSVQFEFIHD